MHLNHLKFYVVCIMVEGMSVVVNVMLSLTSVMVVKLCTFSVFDLGVSLVSWIVMTSACVL